MEIYFFEIILKQLKNRFLYMCVLHMSHILQICQLFQNTCDIIIVQQVSCLPEEWSVVISHINVLAELTRNIF
jgi:hypothetical protein